jgi:hypothetical protein
VLSRRAGEEIQACPGDFAFLVIAYSHEANQFGIRAGRLKNPFGFNDTRRTVYSTKYFTTAIDLL